MNDIINIEPSLQKARRAVIQFVSNYYRRSVNTRVPSLREICRDKDVLKACGGACYPKKLEPVFPPELDGPGPLMQRVCKASHVPVPTARIRKAKRATAEKVKKAKRRGKKKPAKRDVEPSVTEVQETARQLGSLEDIQRSIEIQNAQERYREKTAKEEVERLKILFRDPNPKVSGPVKDAIGELMPEITEHMFGIKVTVPELIGMQKTYDEATEEGWYVEDVFEWAALSKEEQEDFKEQRQKALDEGLSVGEYISTSKAEVERKKAESDRLSGEIERRSRIIEGQKREEESLNRRCSSLNRWLTEDYQSKKKRLEEKYLRDIDGCKAAFLEFKGKVQAMKKELIDDYKGWETKRDRLITECENIEKQFDIRVKAACETLDKIKAETTEARNELKQLRASVGSKGTVADLVKQKEDLKATLTDKDQQLAEKALWLSRDFNARMEAEHMVTEERENTLLLAEHLIEKAGDLPHLFLLLSDPQHFPKEHFKELNSLMDELQVWRGYENPPNLYKGILSKSKAPLNHIKADIEKYME